MTLAEQVAGSTDRWGVVPQRLRPHRPRPEQIDRAVVLDRITAADAAVVVLVAAAGYGKSTTLSQLAQRDHRAAAWITLDPSDADPVVLVRHLVRALALGGVDVAEVEAALSVAEPQLWRAVVPRLATALDGEVEPFLLVVDDVHLVVDASARLLDHVLDLVPDGSRVVLAGRGPGGLELARRRLAGRVLELGQDDLAFEPAEARSLVDVAAPALSPTMVDELLRVTEGWPAGVHLGILALRDHPDPPVVMGGLLTSDHRVVEYLQQVVLDRLAPDDRRFLTEISVLERPSGPLCDATTGGSGGATRLAALVASGNVFLSPVIDAPDTYRLHQLFADLLVMELRRVDPGREPVLRRNAARWEADHGQADAAVRQALSAGDHELAARIVYAHHSKVMLRGEVTTLRRWIDSFPGDVVATNGLLALAAGWAAVSAGDRATVEHHLGAARKLQVEGPLPDGSATFELAVAALEMIAALDGVEGTARCASMLLDAGPSASPWWRLARSQRAIARVAAGLEEPVEAFHAAELDTRGQPSVHLVALSQLALAHLHAGDVRRAEQLSRQAVDEAAEHGLWTYTIVGMFHCVASLIAATVGDLDGSLAHAKDAEGILELCDEVAPRAAIQARQVLAESALVRGDLALAASLLRDAGRRLEQEPDALGWARLQAELEERVDEARRAPQVEQLTAAELRVLQHLPTHRSLVEIGAELYVSRNTVKSHSVAIYRKLGVAGRSEAVQRARELGLIEPTGAPER